MADYTINRETQYDAKNYFNQEEVRSLFVALFQQEQGNYSIDFLLNRGAVSESFQLNPHGKIKLPKIILTGLSNYDAEKGYKKGGMSVELEEHKLKQLRSASWNVTVTEHVGELSGMNLLAQSIQTFIAVNLKNEMEAFAIAELEKLAVDNGAKTYSVNASALTPAEIYTMHNKIIRNSEANYGITFDIISKVDFSDLVSDGYANKNPQRNIPDSLTADFRLAQERFMKSGLELIDAVAEGAEYGEPHSEKRKNWIFDNQNGFKYSAGSKKIFAIYVPRSTMLALVTGFQGVTIFSKEENQLAMSDRYNLVIAYDLVAAASIAKEIVVIYDETPETKGLEEVIETPTGGTPTGSEEENPPVDPV